jgi:hypothetical protein
MARKFRDKDLLEGMQYHLDYDSVVYGANGHYAIGAYYDKTKVSSVFGDKDYNSQDAIDEAENAGAVGEYKISNEDFQEYVDAAPWMKEV